MTMFPFYSTLYRIKYVKERASVIAWESATYSSDRTE